MKRKKTLSFALALMIAANMCAALTVSASVSSIVNLVTGEATIADMTTIPTGFTAQSSTTTVLSIEDEALKVVGTGSSAKSAIKTGISVTNGNTYALEAKMKSGSGNQQIKFLATGSLSLTSSDSVNIDVTEEWNTVRCQISVSGTSKQLKLVPINNTTTWYVDDLKIYDITNAKELTVPETVKITDGAVEYNSKYIANVGSMVTFENADAVNTTLSEVKINTTPIIPDSNGVYSFEMPNENSTITALASVAPFELSDWEFDNLNTNIDPFKESVWLEFDSAIGETLSGVTVTHNHPTITDLPDVGISIDSQKPTKLIIAFNEPLLEETTYTIDFNALRSESNVAPTTKTAVSFTTATYPKMTFSADFDGNSGVARDIGNLKIISSHNLDASTVNNTNITITPNVAPYSVEKTADKEITVTVSELDENTSYTISVSSEVKSNITNVKTLSGAEFTFTSGQYPVPNFVSASISDGAENVTTYTSGITFNYDVALNPLTVNNTTVTVLPAVDYTVSAAGNVVEVTFNEILSKSTTYTVSVTNAVKSINDVSVVEKAVSFTTDMGFENFIKNPGFDTDVIDLDDAQDMTLVKIVELDGERVLRWKPSWGTAPLYIMLTVLPGHKYFMSMDLKSDTAHTVAWQGYYKREGDSSDWKAQQSVTNLVPNADFVTVSAIHQIPSTGMSAEGTNGRFRIFTAAAGGTVWVDNVKFYDMTVSPVGTPTITKITPDYGATDISPFTEEVKIIFDKPMDPTTLGGISINNGAAVLSRKLNDSFTECTVEVSGLAVNKTYTVSVPASVKSMHGEAVTASSPSFSTWEVSTSSFGQVVKGTENMDSDGKLDTGVIHLVFTEYADKTTLVPENFIVSYSLGGVSSVEVTPQSIIKGDKDVKILIPKSAIKNGATYTVKCSAAIKSMTDIALSSNDVIFTTKGAADIEAKFTSISNITEAQSFMENDYKDMLQNNDLYDSIIAGENISVKNAIYADLVSHTATSYADIIEEINNAIIVAMANNSATNEEGKNLITSNALGLDYTEIDGTNIINIYNNTLTETQRAEFDKLIKNKVFTSTTAEGIRNEIAKELVIFTVKNSESWEPIRQTFENSKTYFGTNTANIKTLVANINSKCVQASVYRLLQGYAATGFDNLYSQLKASYDAVVAQQNNQQNTGTAGGGGGGVFSGPASVTNTNLAPNEKKDVTANTLFNDLGSHSWAVKAIDNLYARGIISGKSEGNFAPGEDVTRNEFVKMMVVAVGKYDKGATVEFNDLPSTHWSYAYVASAVNAGLVNGIGEDLFGTDGRMSRQDVAVLVYNAMKNKNIAAKSTEAFKDIDKASEYAKDAITFLKQIGVVNGDGSGNYNPQSSLTRAEAAVILNAVLAYFE